MFETVASIAIYPNPLEAKRLIYRCNSLAEDNWPDIVMTLVNGSNKLYHPILHIIHMVYTRANDVCGSSYNPAHPPYMGIKILFEWDEHGIGRYYDQS